MNPERLMTDTLYVADPAGLADEYGNASYGSIYTVKARKLSDTERVELGLEDSSDKADVFLTCTAIPEGTRVWLSLADAGDANLARTAKKLAGTATPNKRTNLYRYAV